MNPYARFRLISNTASAMLVAGTLCAVWPALSDMIAAATGGLSAAYGAATVLAAFVSVAGWLALSEAVFPALFQIGLLRRLVLGRAYVEGTWIQAERGPAGSERLTVLQVRPAGFGFQVSGYSLNADSEIESNRMIEFCKLDGPVMSYIYRSLMPDGAGGQVEGASELMFEPHRGAPKSYTGYGQPTGASRRFAVEGVKLTKGNERRRLRKLEQRAEITARYWNLFFGAAPALRAADEPPTVRRPVIVETNRATFLDRRRGDTAPPEGTIVARRRASDWRNEDMTPTADRIRARMMAEAARAEEDQDLEDEMEDERQFGAGEEVMFEDEADDMRDVDDELEAGDDFEEETGSRTMDDEEESEPVVIRQRYTRR